MTTKSETCTDPAARTAPAPSRGARDITLGLCAAGYLALVLFDDVESPLMTLVLAVLVGYELVEPHLRHH